MKKFSKQIEIVVEVDAIAQQLRNMFKDESAHADTVVEQIIGRAMVKDNPLLGKIMSAMNGFQKEIIVQIGKTYPISNVRVYAYWGENPTEATYGNISEATVIGINPYSDDEIHIEYVVLNKEGLTKVEKKWVSAACFTV